jgi:lysophospholipase L1-like esterase
MSSIRLIQRLLYLTPLALIIFLYLDQGRALAHEPAERVAGHVVVGDSIECSVVFDPGVPQFGVGYVQPFHDYVETELGSTLDLVNLCKIGATSREVVTEQLIDAAFEARARDVVVVTVGGVGGNNLRRFIVSPEGRTCSVLGFDTCINRLDALLNEIEQNIRLTLQTLRKEVGDENAIVVRTQYNSLRGTSIFGTPCAPPELVGLGDVALEGGGLLEGLNQRIRRIAAEFDAGVADIFFPFAADPSLISGDCIHPTEDGYIVILNASVSAF